MQSSGSLCPFDTARPRPSASSPLLYIQKSCPSSSTLELIKNLAQPFPFSFFSVCPFLNRLFYISILIVRKERKKFHIHNFDESFNITTTTKLQAKKLILTSSSANLLTSFLFFFFFIIIFLLFFFFFLLLKTFFLHLSIY